MVIIHPSRRSRTCPRRQPYRTPIAVGSDRWRRDGSSLADLLIRCATAAWSVRREVEGNVECRTAGFHKPRGSTRPNRCTSREPVRASGQGEPAGATGSSRWASKLSADDVPHSISRSSVRAAAIFLSRLLFACSLEPVAFTSSLFERLQPAHLVRQQPAITRSSGKQSTGTFADPPYFR